MSAGPMTMCPIRPHPRLAGFHALPGFARLHHGMVPVVITHPHNWNSLYLKGPTEYGYLMF